LFSRINENAIIFEGELEGLMTGEGKRFFSNGYFEGKLENDVRIGFGSFFYKED